MSIVNKATLALCLALAAGCVENQDDPPDGALRYVHAAAGQGSLAFLLEQRRDSDLNYGGGSGRLILDAGQYDVNLNALTLASENPERAATLSITVEGETDHIVVAFDDGGQLSLAEYTRPFADVAAGNAEMQILHAVEGAGAVDVYVEADGADLSAANPRATVTFKQLSDPIGFASGDYRVSITAPGDPSALVYQSGVVTVGDGTSSLLGIYDGTGTTAAPLRTALIASGAATVVALNDRRTPPRLRAAHGVTGSGPLDVVVDSDFSAPLHGAIAFGEIADYADIESGERTIQVTPAANPGVIESEQSGVFGTALSNTLVISGTPGNVGAIVYADDNRGIAARARYRVRSAASSVTAINFYLTEPGTDVTTVPANAAGLVAGGAEFPASTLPGEFEITLVENDGDSSTEDTNILAGPIAVSFEEGRVYDLIIVDATGGGAMLLLTDMTAN